jgi:hypothetical protein
VRNPVVSTRIPPKLLAKLDRYAKRKNLTRSAALAALLDQALLFWTR